MPHFIAKDYELNFPFSKDGLNFKEEFFDLDGKESLILVQEGEMEFLIRKTPHAKGWLFKSEKSDTYLSALLIILPSIYLLGHKEI